MCVVGSPVCEEGLRGEGAATSWAARARPDAEAMPLAPGFLLCRSRSSRSRRSRSASSTALLAPCSNTHTHTVVELVMQFELQIVHTVWGGYGVSCFLSEKPIMSSLVTAGVSQLVDFHTLMCSGSTIRKTEQNKQQKQIPSGVKSPKKKKYNFLYRLQDFQVCT